MVNGTGIFRSTMNETVTLICTVIGLPKPNVTWYVNEVLVTNAVNSTEVVSEYNFTITSWIEITRVLPENNNNIYKCAASTSTKGSTSALIQLLVRKWVKYIYMIFLWFYATE